MTSQSAMRTIPLSQSAAAVTARRLPRCELDSYGGSIATPIYEGPTRGGTTLMSRRRQDLGGAGHRRPRAIHHDARAGDTRGAARVERALHRDRVVGEVGRQRLAARDRAVQAVED